MMRSLRFALLAVLTLGLSPAAFTQSSAAAAAAGKISGTRAMLEADPPSGRLADLPPLPPNSRSTIFGGAIRKIDPVRDQFMLNVYGQRPMKILFDERTKVFKDGVKIPVHGLAPADHASVQTALDGDRIFAISVHILSSLPEGRYRGRVIRFNESSGELKIDAAPSPRPFTVYVPANATIVRTGQSAFTAMSSGRGDLRPGALVDVTFASGAGPIGVVSKINVLAVPGATFEFSGTIASLDIGTGTLVLIDPRDDHSYQIQFYPSEISGSQDLRIGQHVRLSASYNGASYIASEITPY